VEETETQLSAGP